MADNILNIDGSVLEGGGQILRISISLSAILKIPVRITNIRANRSKPGLAAQHLKGIQLVADMCGAKLKGANIGSTEIEFVPGKIRGGHYIADTKTAGSISLLLQVALPVALLADDDVTLDLKGGTNAEMAPQIDYMELVFRPLLNKFGGDFRMEILRRGYYPRGGGHVCVTVSPMRALRAASLTYRGDAATVHGYSFAAGTLPLKMAVEMADGAKQSLAGEKVDIRCVKEDRNMAPDNCAGIILHCLLSGGSTLGADALCGRGARAYDAGAKAGAALRDVIVTGAVVDTHAQDQLIVYMTLAEGRSALRVGEVTLHTKTAIYIVETITKIKIDVRPDGQQNIIECTGLGYVNPNMADT
ncbi:RNA 3'-terminal phosphate cyclase [Aricia agestis]|uniref:RNA 3'-terminal phosphate cyclase n=1 Tax=Aricia agestis TaxID=91739 RepID=UPI001C201F65|nr:RNA 3'-terminal phosphate cyclase [Aricia agestis]